MKPAQILATGLLFFLLFIPLFAFIGDIRILCEINDTGNCTEYALMQGISAAGLVLGLLLSVGGAYKLRRIAVNRGWTSVEGMFSTIDEEKDNVDTFDEIEEAEKSFIREYGIDDKSYKDVAYALDQERNSAENTIQHLLQQLDTLSSSDTEMVEIRQKQKELQKRVVDIENAKKQMAKEMANLKSKPSESNMKMQDSVVGGNITLNDPQQIARAAIEAYKLGTNEQQSDSDNDPN